MSESPGIIYGYFGVKLKEEKDDSMKIWHKVTMTITMILVIFALLITGFQLAIYGDSHYGFYKKEYEKYRVTDDLNMNIYDVMTVTEYMMDYLIGKEEELSIVTDVDGEQQDFFNEQDRLHMADVKNLFLGGLKLRNYAVIFAIILLILLGVKKADLRRLVPSGYLQALLVYLVLVVFLGIAMSIDFTRCFTLFHQMFFTNDLWLFDPATDYMIRMLPEGFFSDMIIRIGTTFIVLLAVPGAAAILYQRKLKRD